MKVKISLIFALWILSACASSGKNAGKVTFENLKKIAVPTTNQNSVKSTLGEPNLVTALPTGEVVWVYLNDSKKSTRTSVVFQKKSDLLSEINWFPDENENENLSSLSQILNGSEFESQKMQVQAHAVPSESLMVDARRGITVVYKTASGKISSIGWDFQNLGRNPAKEK